MDCWKKKITPQIAVFCGKSSCKWPRLRTIEGCFLLVCSGLYGADTMENDHFSGGSVHFGAVLGVWWIVVR